MKPKTFKFVGLHCECEAKVIDGRLEIEMHDSSNLWSVSMTKAQGQLVVTVICEPDAIMSACKAIHRLEHVFDAKDHTRALNDVVKQWLNH